jgi:predicted aspartyl protease
MESKFIYSRRRLLGTSAAALAFAPTVLHAGDDAAPSLPDLETIHGNANRDHRMTVSALIDGKGPYRFLVDTGADRSVLAADVAQQLGLIGGDDVVVQGISRSIPATTALLHSLKVGTIEINDIAVPVLSREWLGADGYLGLDILDRRRVTFDFRYQTLTIDRSNQIHGFEISRDLIVRVKGANGRLTAYDCRVDDVPAAAFVDSGAQVTIGNSLLFAELQKRGSTYVSDRIVPVTDVTGGTSPGRITSFSTIRLGAISFVRANLLISDLEVFNVWGLSDRPALFIGMNFLGQTSAFSIDFARKQLQFKLADERVARSI